MKLTREMWIAVALWLLVGALAGAVVAALLNWQGQYVVVGGVIGFGVAALIIIRFLNQPLTATPPESKVSAPEATPSGEAAREWLDDFLVRQQQTQ